MPDHHARITYVVRCDSCDFAREVTTLGEGNAVADAHERAPEDADA